MPSTMSTIRLTKTGEPNTDSGEDIELGDYRTEDDIPDYKLQENNRSKEDRAEDIPFSDNVSFYETLKGNSSTCNTSLRNRSN